MFLTVSFGSLVPFLSKRRGDNQRNSGVRFLASMQQCVGLNGTSCRPGRWSSYQVKGSITETAMEVDSMSLLHPFSTSCRDRVCRPCLWSGSRRFACFAL